MHTAPGKLILVGEHAVVYGQPAIAVPFRAVHAEAQAVPSPAGAGLTVIAHDVGQVLHVYPSDETPDNALVYAAQITLRALGANPPDLSLELRSTIPIGGGFGSGAAVSAALIRALSAALDHPLEGEVLNALVYQVEMLHHGTPSGIDNTVIVLDQPVYFVRGQAPAPFTIGGVFTFVVAFSGVSASTREAVAGVRRLYEGEPEKYQPIIAQIGTLVREGRAHIENGDAPALGGVMSHNHELLRQITVSSPLLDRLTEAANKAGAYGVKLSGGGRGGNVIALTPPERAPAVASAMRDAGAQKLWKMALEPSHRC